MSRRLRIRNRLFLLRRLPSQTTGGEFHASTHRTRCKAPARPDCRTGRRRLDPGRAAGCRTVTGTGHQRHTDGKTIGNWGLAWWQWAVRFSSENNPITQTGEVDCAAGQSGRVWFLAGTFGTSAVRSCSVKAGKALFLGLFNGLFWFPEDCQRPNGCRAAVAAGVDAVTNWTCTIDGKPCIYTNQVVRDQSDPLPITFPPHSFVVTDFKYSPGRRDFAIADGYWVMLEPLAVGPHIIRFTSTAPGGFALDVTFNLTVTP